MRSSSQINERQFDEYIRIFQRMPAGLSIDLGGGSHAVGSSIQDKGTVIPYDPNHISKALPTRNILKYVKSTIDYKYIFLGELSRNKKFYMDIAAYYFGKDKKSHALKSYSYFRENEFPVNKYDAENFQRSSPNSFSHLHIAVIVQSVGDVSSLIKGGLCDVNSTDCLGRTPLKIAIENNFTNGTKIMLTDKDIKLDSPDDMGLAYKNEMYEVVDKIIEHPNSKNLYSLLISAIRNHDLEYVKKVFESGKIDINIEQADGLPLVAALKDANEDIISFLIDQGAKLNANDPSQQHVLTPLKYVCQRENKYVDLILNRLDDIDCKDQGGRTALYYAADARNPDLIKKILAKHADCRIGDSPENNPIYKLTKWYGFHLSFDDKLSTCLLAFVPYLDVNKQTDIKFLKKLFITAIKMDDKPLFDAILSVSNIDALRVGFGVEGGSVLHLAAFFGRKKMLKDLLNYKTEDGRSLDPNLVNNEGETPLHYAVHNNSSGTAEILLDNSVKTNLSNKKGETVIDVLNQGESEACRKLFVEKGLMQGPTLSQ